MIKILLVGAGGCFGSICRYLAGELAMKYFPAHLLLYTTLAINVTGCLLIGFIGGLTDIRQVISPELRTLIVVGFLGGFTTFSTFGYESFVLAKGGQIIPMLANLFLHISLGLGAVWLGFSLTEMV